MALVVVCVVWGTTYLAIKVALEAVPPFVMGGMRYVAAGAILAAILKARGRALPSPSSWPRLMVLGFCMMALGNGGVVWGEQFVPSGLTAVVVGTSAFWLVGINAVVFRHETRLHAREWIGLAIGFFGIVLLVWPDISLGGLSGRRFAAGVVALQIACAGWAVGSVYARKHVTSDGVLGSAAMQMIFGGLMMMAMGTAVGEWAHIGWSGRSVAAVSYLVIAGAVIGFAAYSYALQHLPVSVVSIYTYVNPMIAVGLGTWLLGEAFHLRMLVAAAVIIVGVAIVGRGAAGRETRRPIKATGALLIVALALLAHPASAQTEPADRRSGPARTALFFTGAAAGLVIHESGHVMFGAAFGAHPTIAKLDYGPIPFFAIHHDQVTRRQEYVISSAGLWMQHAGSELILSARPHLKDEPAPFLKGILAFNLATSAVYSVSAFGRFGPPERDPRGIAVSLGHDGVPEPVVGALILAPAVLDGYRYLHPERRWPVWASRSIKIASVALAAAAGR